ncbi:MAG: glucose-1-phosphate adenylyltransferase [Dehalococcoidia bacterium]|nr:glucose-1-phosphate adenylyltransferase [Dehalococcoidia bacterium]
MAMILAGGSGERLSVLTEERSKPAVPFGGLYRVIDFTISNCVNSGIHHIAVLTQYRPRSLAEHILGSEQRWEQTAAAGRIRMLHPYLSRDGHGWYKGTADAVFQNLSVVDEGKVDEVLILAGDHVYLMDYNDILRYHRMKRAEVTVGLVEVPLEVASQFGLVTWDVSHSITGFQEKPKDPASTLASMGIYVFNKEILVECLERDAAEEGSGHDFGRDIMPHILKEHKVVGYKFNDYWRDVGTVEAYWQANMDLIVDLPPLNLYGLETKVFTFPRNPPPVKLGPHAQVSRSLICNGSIINGRVVNSVISDRVFVEDDAVVADSIVFSDTTIGKGALIHRSIIDKEVSVGQGCHIGFGEDYTPNSKEPEYLNSGITLVGKGSKIPDGERIGRNVRVGCLVDKGDFPSDFIPSGASVEKKKPRRHRV